MDAKSFIIGATIAGGGHAPTPTYQDKEITITQNGEQTITADSGYNALSSVEITTNVPQPSGKITITENGTDIDVSSYATADVNVPAGADLSDYFTSTISSNNDSYASGFGNTIKKLPDFDASGTSLKYAFNRYKGTTLPKINNISNVTNFSYFCVECVNLVNVDLSTWDFGSNINNMMSMFENCTSLEEIDLSSIHTIQGGTQLLNVFYGCTSLKKIDLSNFALNGGSNGCGNMFYNCTSLEYLDMSKFSFTSESWFNGMFTGVPANCLIYVKNQTQKDWFTTNFPSLTNVQIKGA